MIISQYVIINDDDPNLLYQLIAVPFLFWAQQP